MSAAPAADALVRGFHDPPDSARPRVWWHWMDGNVTEEGIHLDLVWMHRVGIGGVQAFDAAFSTPARVNQPLLYMTPEWQHAFRVASSTAAQLHLEFSIAGSPGFSESGGPWVEPEEGMKKLVWSSMRINGGQAFIGKIPRPPSTIGPFQNLPIDHRDFLSGGVAKNPPKAIYADVAVLAYRLPPLERSMAELNPTVTCSAGPLEGTPLWDGDLQKAISIPFFHEGFAWVQVAFQIPQTIYAVTLAQPTFTAVQLQSSADGHRFSPVIDLPPPADAQQTLAFAPVTARYFRLQLATPTSVDAGVKKDFVHVKNPTAHRIAEFILHTAPRVHRAEDKAGFFQGFLTGPDLDEAATPAAPSETLMRKADIVDLTSRLQSDGTLKWTPPPGRWEILRLGYSLLGTTNHPASPEATGLEVDKLSRAHVQANTRRYLDRFAQFLGPDLIGPHGLHGMVNDSAEVGAQNWTESLPTEFSRRRGYDLTAWLPTLTGRIIDSAESTERFLWDFRQTLGELMAENHYGAIAEELHRRGMIHYAEAHEVARAFIGDGMATKRFSDIPMGAMWAGELFQPESGDADIRESASVAHLYGQNLVAAESFTASDRTYAYTPQMLKPVADRELIQGVNRFVIHASVHQPLNDPGPGFTLGPYGQWFTRHETWAEQAGPWVQYLTRSAFLLQQGRFVADVLYFYGEDSNITALYAAGLPPIPEGFNFDFANADALNLLSVDNGQLVTRSGMHYAVLVLDPRTRVMSLPVLNRLRELVKAGAILIGAKPQTTPSLADAVSGFRVAADELWGSGDVSINRKVGRGRVIHSANLAAAIAQLQIEPDFAYEKPAPDSKVWFVHRLLSDADLYFIDNRQPRMEEIDASFRVNGKLAELWHADTGRIEPVSYRIEGYRTTVPLRLDPAEAVFVVFRKPATESERTVAPAHRSVLSSIEGPWDVHFATAQGAPAYTQFPKLTSWIQNVDRGIKYYSGTASYRNSLNVRSAWLKAGTRIELDLGRVKDLAEVWVNGQSMGVVWKAPFRIDITDPLHGGKNRLEIRVTNTWVNRLIGDKQPGAKPYAYATFDPYKADSPLLEAGLLGPVYLQQLTSGEEYAEAAVPVMAQSLADLRQAAR